MLPLDNRWEILVEEDKKKKKTILGHMGVNYLLALNNQHVELEQGGCLRRSLI